MLSKVYDESTGAEYYYNSQTGTAAWEKPRMLEPYDLADFQDGPFL